MAAENERLIFGSLRDQKAFRRDLQRFFETPPEVLKSILDRTTVQPYTALSETEAEELADKFELQVEDLQRTAAILLLLKQRLIDTGLNPSEAVTESRSVLGLDDLARGREDEFADILSYSEDEREESLAVQAFSSGPAFLNLGMLPSLLPATPSGAELTGAYLLSISYLNAEGESRSITIGLTPGELEQIETTIQRAKEQLKSMRQVVGSARTVED